MSMREMLAELKKERERIVNLASPVSGRVRRINDGLMEGVEGFGAWAVQMDVENRRRKE